MRIQHGIEWWGHKMECACSNAKKGWVTFMLTTAKQRMFIYITKTGVVRISDDATGQAWLPIAKKTTAKRGRRAAGGTKCRRTNPA